MPKTILAISGSLRANSTNTSLLVAMIELAPPGVTLNLYDGMDTLPHFSPERDIDPIPETVRSLRSHVNDADAVLICTPEYIHGMPGALKNMLDWIASSGEFVDKPVGVLSASPSDMGGSRAHASLHHTIEVLTANIPHGASLIVPFVRQRLDNDGHIIDPILRQQLQAVIDTLVRTIQE